MSEHVRSELSNGVLAITLARPERRNAITVDMYQALADAIRGASGNPEVRVITLRGEGADFTAGNDLADFLKSGAVGGESDPPVWQMMRAFAANEIPIVAAVHGNAVGIGTTMLFHCDLVLAEEGCRFVMPFVDLGLVPEFASSLLMPRLSGRRGAARHLLLGEPFGASQALALGIASHVVPKGELAETLAKVTSALIAKPAEAFRLTQRLLRLGTRDEVMERVVVENDHFSERLGSDEVKQAIANFFAERSTAGPD